MVACTTGANNVGLGLNALGSNVTANNNTAVGYNALYACTATQNSALGLQAGDGITTGTNSTCLGQESDNSAVDAGNEFTMGNSSISNLRCNDTSISSLSDERDKTQIEDLPEEAGLGFINNLKPRTFYWDRREWYDEEVANEDGSISIVKHDPDGSKVKPYYRRWRSNSGQRMGFISQEVQTAIDGLKYMEDSQIVNGTTEKLEFAPAHFITPLIKAVQQLSAEVESLKAQLEES